MISAVASQSINDVFSATYQNYRIFFDLTGSTNYALSMRLRVSGADNTTSNYALQYVVFTGTGSIIARDTAQTSWNLDGAATVNRNQYILDISNPFATEKTSMLSYASLAYGDGANIKSLFNAHGFVATTSFTGYSIIASTGNMTGTVRTYGYNQ